MSTLIDSESHLTFYPPPSTVLSTSLHVSHAHHVHFGTLSVCIVVMHALEFFIQARAARELHCCDHVKWTVGNGYVENSM